MRIAHTTQIVRLCVIAILLTLLGTHVVTTKALAQTLDWAAPINISNTPNSSWFPDIAVDRAGNVHVVWCETTQLARGEGEQILYTRRDEQGWLAPNDLVARQPDIRRNAIAIGSTGDLLMVFMDSRFRGWSLFFSSAPAMEAWSAAAWSPHRSVTAHGLNYMPDLAVDAIGVIHLLFDDKGRPPPDVDFAGYSDIYYRQSHDNGRSWSIPVNLSVSPVGSSRGRLAVGPDGVLHATWDDGWDRLSDLGEPTYSVYRASFDNGLSWSTPVTVAYPTTGTAQLTAAADGSRGVMLVWRNTAHEGIYYQWSRDHGQTWSPPAALPKILARSWDIPFDLYDMVTDSAGTIHLLAVGREHAERDAPLGLYHTAWDGRGWSPPECVFCGWGYPEYPRLAVHEGNRLHAVWFVRDNLWTRTNYEVYYSEAVSAAPRQTAVPWPTATATATAQPSPTAVPTATPLPTLAMTDQGFPEDLYTEGSHVTRLAIAIAPVAGSILLLFALRALWRRLRH